MDLCHLKNSELDLQFQQYKGRVVLRKWHCERWFWFLCSIHWTRIISFTNDGCKSNNGHYIKTTRMRRTSSRRSISLHPGQNGRCADVVENSKVRIRLPKHRWWSSMEDPVVLLERNLYGHPLTGQLWERQFEKILLKHGWEKVSTWDNSRSYAVFTEQGSSASQMTAAKIMDIISRLPGCAGQAADAVSAYTQVKMEDAHKLLKIPKSECPDIWIRLPRHKWPKSWSSIEDPVVPLERNLYGQPLTGLSWEKQFEKVLLKYGWDKVLN